MTISIGFTLFERENLLLLKAKGCSITAIAEKLGRNKGTISRELRRNTSKGEYMPVNAQQQYQKRRFACRPRKRLDNASILEHMRHRLLECQWSPEEIAGRLRAEFGQCVISTTTIYRAIYSGMLNAPKGSTASIVRKPVAHTGKTATLLRDYEYERLGTLSLLAAIDLLTGEAVPLVSETHKSRDFITFLQKLDEKYPKGDKIRLILDNHSAHTSTETQGYLNTVPGRFEFVFTPTHGSWLNMIEGFFSKMTRQMLTGIRVASKEELTRRIYLYFEEINQTPIPYKWKYQMDDIDLENEDIDSIVYEVVNAKAASFDNKGKRAPIPITRRKNKADTTC